MAAWELPAVFCQCIFTSARLIQINCHGNSIACITLQSAFCNSEMDFSLVAFGQGIRFLDHYSTTIGYRTGRDKLWYWSWCVFLVLVMILIFYIFVSFQNCLPSFVLYVQCGPNCNQNCKRFLAANLSCPSPVPRLRWLVTVAYCDFQMSS